MKGLYSWSVWLSGLCSWYSVAILRLNHPVISPRSGETTIVYGDLFGNRRGRNEFQRFWRRWEDNIKMVLEEIVWECVDWVYLPPNSGRLLWIALKLHTSYIACNLLTRWATISFTIRALPCIDRALYTWPVDCAWVEMWQEVARQWLQLRSGRDAGAL
jgi:hypothetical protein